MTSRSPVATALALGALCLASGASCRKAPFFDVGARFALADVSWFEAEETLFVFYEVTAEQGLGDNTVIELSYATDDERVDWTPLEDFEWVHTHVDVDCGPNARCGSASLRVPILPREVALRMRYHVDGELAKDAVTAFNVVEAGPAHTHRSLLVYGVFDETNQYVQWRARHQFPTLRNQEAEAYGLRRAFEVSGAAFGEADPTSPSNPYGYGFGDGCPNDYVAAGLATVRTAERAVFQTEPLPLGASESPVVCGVSTVTDAVGTFVAGAFALKNPEVRPAFPVLRSPVHDAEQLKFFLAPCERTIDAAHEAMQRQRLQMEGVPTTCIDDWAQPGFVDELVVALRDRVEAERVAGEDMVLTVALHQDEDGVSEVVEAALAQVVPDERHRTTPRLAGAFVLDSVVWQLTVPELSPVTLWCPSSLYGYDASARACATAPDNPAIELGPLTLGMLPILPSRDQYLEFVDTFGKAQAGEVDTLTFRVPEFSATADHVDLGEYGVVTFLDGEAIDAAPRDAFSYCAGTGPELVVFRSDLLAQGDFLDCEYLGLDPSLCESGVLTLDLLPDWHAAFAERSYELGVFWEFPFLLRMSYEAVAAGAVGAFGLSVPFGFASDEETYYGTATWLDDEFHLEEVLTQCDRWCDHPTFDSAGVYHPTDPFRTTYPHTCYLPVHPAPGDSGFPLDP